MNDLTAFSFAVSAAAVNYLLHSTFLLVSCWLVVRVFRLTSPYVTERMWKLAAVLGILTSAAHLAFGERTPISGHATTGGAIMPSVSTASDAPPGARGFRRRDDRAVETVAGSALFSGPNVEATPEAVGFAGEVRAVVVTTGAGESPRPDVAVSSTDDGIAPRDRSDSGGGEGATSIVVDDRRYRTARRSDSAPASSEITPLMSVAAGSGAMLILLVVSAGFATMTVQTSRFRRTLSSARRIEGGRPRRLLDRFLRRAGIRREVRLLESDRFATPIAFGLVRWTIVLPSGAAGRLDNEALRALLAHEIAHLVRGDARWLWIGRILCACAAVQPLNRLARRRWQQAAECLCDDWAVRRGVRGLTLARCLTEVAGWGLNGPVAREGLSAVDARPDLVRRVRRLVDDESRRDRWSTTGGRRALALVASVAAASTVLALPRIAVPVPTLAATSADSFVSDPTRRDETADGVAGDTGAREVGARRLALQGRTPRDYSTPWRGVHDEMSALDADLRRADALLSRIPPDSETELLAREIRSRGRRIISRRDFINSLLNKEHGQ